jgi:hypothetical protein
VHVHGAGLNRHLGLDDHLFVLGDSVVLTVLGQISFLPLLVLAARSCPGVRFHSVVCHLRAAQQMFCAGSQNDHDAKTWDGYCRACFKVPCLVQSHLSGTSDIDHEWAHAARIAWERITPNFDHASS